MPESFTGANGEEHHEGVTSMPLKRVSRRENRSLFPVDRTARRVFRPDVRRAGRYAGQPGHMSGRPVDSPESPSIPLQKVTRRENRPEFSVDRTSHRAGRRGVRWDRTVCRKESPMDTSYHKRFCFEIKMTCTI